MLPLQRFNHFIEQYQLFNHEKPVLVALSGGVDSTLMVHLLQQSGYKYAIAHCNFQLRGANADADQQFCRQLAAQNKVPFHTINFDTEQYARTHKISIQMAARDMRYQWFEHIRAQHQYACIVLAHHQNDTIETILLNLVRGTGIAGLHGILPKNGHLARPMLCFTRTEIEQIAAENKIAYVEDSSNASVKYARNKLRHKVVPILKELNPALEQTFENNLQHFKELEQLLELTVASLKESLFSYRDTDIYIPIAGIKQLQPQRLLLYKLLHNFGFNKTTVNDIISSLDKHSGRVFEAGAYLLVLDRGHLIVSQKKEAPVMPLDILADSKTLHYGVYRLTILHDDTPLIIKNNPFAVAVDSEKLLYPLTMRAWQQSDHFFPLGLKGKKKLSDFFIGQKIPLHKKNAIPLLVNGNGEIIWVAGYRPDERHKVTPDTKKVTIFELFTDNE